jgi:hypothetical protein
MPQPKRRARPTIHVREFREDAVRLLPRRHPLLKVLRGVPDELTVEEFRVRVGDWLALLDEEA